MRDMQDEAGAPLIPADDHIPPTTPSPATSTPSPHRRRLFVLLAAAALAAYVADQVTKAWALAALTPGDPVPLVGDFIRLNLIRNPGAAFSIGTGNTWVLTIVAVVVLIVVIRVSRRLGSIGWAWALGLLLGGALGNLTDRVVREPGLGRGHVVDFLNYNNWFIGNIADIAIVSAAILIGLLALTGRSVDGTRDSREAGRPEAADDGS